MYIHIYIYVDTYIYVRKSFQRDPIIGYMDPWGIQSGPGRFTYCLRSVTWRNESLHQPLDEPGFRV